MTKFIEVICGVCGGSGKRTITVTLYDRHGRPTDTRQEEVGCAACGGNGKIKVRV